MTPLPSPKCPACGRPAAEHAAGRFEHPPESPEGLALRAHALGDHRRCLRAEWAAWEDEGPWFVSAECALMLGRDR